MASDSNRWRVTVEVALCWYLDQVGRFVAGVVRKHRWVGSLGLAQQDTTGVLSQLIGSSSYFPDVKHTHQLHRVLSPSLCCFRTNTAAASDVPQLSRHRSVISEH